jgi:hypothetical protein
MVKLFGEILQTVRKDTQERLVQAKSAKKKMDEDDLEYFEEDLRKVHKVEHCKQLIRSEVHYSHYGISWSFGSCVQGTSE